MLQNVFKKKLCHFQPRIHDTLGKTYNYNYNTTIPYILLLKTGNVIQAGVQDRILYSPEHWNHNEILHEALAEKALLKWQN